MSMPLPRRPRDSNTRRRGGGGAAARGLLVIALLAIASLLLPGADWPGWRGPTRDGAATESPPLAASWPEEGPRKVWESEPLPARSGEGSPVVAGGKAYLLVNRQEDEPIPTRTIDGRVLGRLRWFDQDDMPPELLGDVEAARLARPQDLRGKALDAWIDGWMEEHLPGEEDRKWRRVAERRLEDGPDATPLDVLAKLGEARDREFPSQEALETWLDEEEISGTWREEILESVRTTRRVASDVILALDLASGETVWKKELEGKPDSSGCSSTPAVAEGRVYVAGSTRAHCLDAATGEPVWSVEVSGGGVPSSFLIAGDRAVLLAGRLVCLDRRTGEVLWEQKEVRGKKSSPVLWRHGGRDRVIANGDRGEVACVDLERGEVLWKVPGGGPSTPVVEGDRMVLHSSDKELGLVAYALAPEGARRLWSHPVDGRGASSPLVHEGHVYLAGGNAILCIELASGRLAWEKNAPVEISSPVLADGKILLLTGKGAYLSLIEASPAAYRELARARVRAAWCPSPALAGGLLVVRGRSGVSCYDVRPSGSGRPASE